MPPKRKQPARKSSASASTSKTTAAPRRSKLAKENNISADEEAEILDAFDLFAVHPTTSDSPSASSKRKEKEKDRQIATKDIRRALIALNTPPKDSTELSEITSTVDPDDSGWVSYEHFLAVAALKLHAKHDDPDAMDEEVRKAYLLFTKGQEREITLGDLRRVARELREEIPENVLRDMLREATGGGVGGVGGVGMEEFEGVMRRAGVFG